MSDFLPVDQVPDEELPQHVQRVLDASIEERMLSGGGVPWVIHIYPGLRARLETVLGYKIVSWKVEWAAYHLPVHNAIDPRGPDIETWNKQRVWCEFKLEENAT